MQISLQHIVPHPILTKYIDKMWVFNSAGQMPSDDMKLVVPNGLAKLIIPFRNGVIGKIGSYHHHSMENHIILIGITDTPAVVDIETDAPSGSIGIEFSACGTYQFFNLYYRELRNRIFSLSDVLGRLAGEIEDRVYSAAGTQQKVAIIQQYLIQLFSGTEDQVFDYCIQRIQSSTGRVSVKELVTATGYSARWLNMKFEERLGISPKNYASIIRFQKYYKALLRNNESDFFKNDFYHYYYDQSHFIKDFKRFTGFPPKKFEQITNKFGDVFYKG